MGIDLVTYRSRIGTFFPQNVRIRRVGRKIECSWMAIILPACLILLHGLYLQSHQPTTTSQWSLSMWNTSLPKNNSYQPGPVTSHLTSNNVTCVYGYSWSPTLTIHTMSESTRIKPPIVII